MTKDFSRRFILGGLAASAASTALANAPERSLRPHPRHLVPAQARASSADALIAAAGLGGQVTFAVADARSGVMLEGYGAGRKMPPASVAKAVTSMYGLRTLGPGHRFRTQVIAAGAIRNGRLDGDLILAGTGDPTLTTDELAALAASVKAAGLREVSGRFMVQSGALPYVRSIDPDQPDHVGYNPSVSGLNLNYNRVHFEWKRGQGGYQVSMDARTDRFRPAVSIARMRVADRRSPLYTYADRNGVDDWTVAAQALGNGGSRWLPVRRPAEYAGQVFQVLMRSHGVVLRDPAPMRGSARGTVLAEHVSDDLAGILRGMLRWSTNLTAEVVGMSASSRLGGAPASLRASGQRMSRWLEGNSSVQNARFVDHSGLGEDSRISATDMVRALVQAGPDGGLRQLMRRIDMKDGNGRVIRNHPAQVAAKTGTLNFVSGLGGYVQTPSNEVLAFAIFSADLDRRRALGANQRERPEGGRAWTRRARALQQKLIERWVAVHGT